MTRFLSRLRAWLGLPLSRRDRERIERAMREVFSRYRIVIRS